METKSNVKAYTDKQLIDKAKSIQGFTHIPENHWLYGVRSNEDENDRFDDKFYLFKGEVCLGVTTGTTNKGNKGTAVMQCGWHYDCYEYGLHKGKVPALRQVKGIPYRRDFTNDKKTNPTTDVKNDIIYMNFHPADYDLTKGIVKTNIGGWSQGCQVANNIPVYEKWINHIFKNNGLTTYLLMDEF